MTLLASTERSKSKTLIKKDRRTVDCEVKPREIKPAKTKFTAMETSVNQRKAPYRAKSGTLQNMYNSKEDELQPAK